MLLRQHMFLDMLAELIFQTLIHASNLDSLVDSPHCRNDTMQNAMLEWVVMSVFLQHTCKSNDPISRGKLQEFTQIAFFNRKVCIAQPRSGAASTAFPCVRPFYTHLSKSYMVSNCTTCNFNDEFCLYYFMNSWFY